MPAKPAAAILSALLLIGCQSARPILKGDLRDGMTQPQVWKQWGPPEQVSTRAAGTQAEETWQWGPSATATFTNGALTYWSR
jgi:hypothetical protein